MLFLKRTSRYVFSNWISNIFQSDYNLLFNKYSFSIYLKVVFPFVVLK
jgi:hypothetical protein